MTHDGRTHAIPFCKRCPSMWEWPARNLIFGVCPRCHRPAEKSWRVLKALRMIGRDPQ